MQYKISAIGTSLNFSGWVVGLSQYFVKRRALALGLAMAGSGVGVLLLGPMLANLVPAIGWRQAMMLCGALSLNFCVFGAFIFKRKTAGTKKNKNSSNFYAVNTGHNTSVDTNCKIPCIENAKSDIPTLSSVKVFAADNSSEINKIESVVLNHASLSKPYENGSTSNENEKLQWLAIQISCVLSIMATSTVFTLLKDWIQWIGLEHITSYCLMAVGIGDIVGRIAAGLLSWKLTAQSSILLLFGSTHVLLAVSLIGGSMATGVPVVLISVVGVGIAGGSHCVLTAVAPMNKGSAEDLGKLLLAGGIGALVGPPLAGFLVDYMNNYSIALIVCAAAPAVAAVSCFLCFFVTYSDFVQKDVCANITDTEK